MSGVLRRSVPIALVALLGVACSGTQGNGDSGEPPVGDTKSPASYRAGMYALPLAGFGMSMTEEAAYRNAVAALTERCMRKKGYAGFRADGLTVATDGSAPATTVEPGGPYGWIDAKNAATRGFHPAETDTAEKSAKFPPDQLQLIFTCSDGAEKELKKGADEDPGGLIDRLISKTMAETLKDSRVRDATASWSSCMKSRGFAYTSPPTGNEWVSKNIERPSAEEIAVATADAACTVSSNLSGIYFAVLGAYQKREVDGNIEALKEVREKYQATVKTARSVLS